MDANDDARNSSGRELHHLNDLCRGSDLGSLDDTERQSPKKSVMPAGHVRSAGSLRKEWVGKNEEVAGIASFCDRELDSMLLR